MTSIATWTATRSITLAVFQLPGSNAVETAKDIKAKMEELKQAVSPKGSTIASFTTPPFSSTNRSTSVFHTLFEAIVLVFIVVLVFLQNWRATLIPMVAVPVSLIGTLCHHGDAGVLAE